MSIKIGTKVIAPVTDNEGEVSYIIGTLVEMNSRMAHVKNDEGIYKVGKTKIEPLAATAEPKSKKAEFEMPEHCPHCDVHLSNGIMSDTNQRADGLERMEKFEYACMNCDGEFGPAIKRGKITADRSNYVECRSASGRKSLDNGDDVALQLRGKPLDEVYKIASGILDETIKSLKSKYNHLNVGQQRMCLGNRVRKAVKG